MAEIIKLSDLEPDDNNANKGTERGRYMIERSLEKLGAGRSILLDKNGKIIAGNKTAQTAGEIGIDDVVVVRTKGDQLVAVMREDLDLDDETGKARELAYADNRAGQVSLDFDPGVIADDFASGVDLSDWFTPLELADFGADITPELEQGNAEPQISRADELQQEWGTELGQLWRLPSRTEGQEHRLICGDCTDGDVVDLLLGDDAVSVVSCDPPYGLGLNVDGQTIGKSSAYGAVINDRDGSVAKLAYKVLSKYGNNVWWGANHWGGSLPDSPCWLVWDKDHHGMTFADAELAWTDISGPVRVFRHAWSGNHRASERNEDRLHINQKPVALFEWYLPMCSDVGDVILDAFLGVGGQLIAAENLSCQCRAIEISPAYVAVALQRYKDAFGIEPELISGKVNG